MTTVEQMQAMTDRIIAEALEVVRAEAEQREIWNRVYNVPQDALEAAQEARERLQAMDDSPEMPSVGYDFTTRPIQLCEDAVEAARWTRLRIQFMHENA